MKKIISAIFSCILKCIPFEYIPKLIAIGISKILEYARKNGGDKWDDAKEVIRQIKNWCALFDKVYKDDKLTEDEERQIENAIKNSTLNKKISDIIKK